MRSSIRSRILCAGIVLFALPGLVFARTGHGNPSKNHHGKIDRALREAIARDSGPQRVIIRTKPGSREAIRRALQAHGDGVAGEQAELGTLAAEIHADDVAALADSEAILTVSFDATVTPDARPEAKTTKTSTLKNANRREAKFSAAALRATLGLTRETTGAGVVVAVIDSGIAPLTDFRGRILASLDCRPALCTPSPFTDEYGHGTHVAGLIAGTLTGVAPGASLVSLRVLDGNGNGKTSDVLKALQWVRDNKTLYGIQVANLSLGHPIYERAETDPLVIAVQETVRAGVKVIVSAGNYGTNPETGVVGYAGIASPGNAPNAITVGAVNTFETVARNDDRVTDYSSRGPTWYDAFLKPDLVAPGHGLQGPLPPSSALKRKHGGNKGQKYVKLNGTSMAAAVTSGVVAVLLQTNQNAWWTLHIECFWEYPYPDHCSAGAPGLTANTLKAILQFTAIPLYDEYGQPYDRLTQGAGGLNGGGALSVAGSLDASLLTPAGQFWMTGSASGTFGQTTIGHESYAWGQNILWDDNIVWGSGLMTHSQAAWDDNIVWGSSGDDNIVWGSSTGDDNIVWGSSEDDNIVWGSVAEWADNIVWGSNLIGMTIGEDNIVWGSDDDNIVWGSDDGDNIVWGSLNEDNIVWGSLADDNVVWGSNDDDDDDGRLGQRRGQHR